jgi:hypothetical protein
MTCAGGGGVLTISLEDDDPLASECVSGCGDKRSGGDVAKIHMAEAIEESRTVRNEDDLAVAYPAGNGVIMPT